MYNPVQTTPFSFKIKFKIRIWHMVWALFYRPTPWFFRRYRIWLLRLFGADVSIHANPHNRAKVDSPWNLTMGKFASIGEDSWIYCLDKIYIADHACVGQGVKLITGSHDVHSNDFRMTTGPISIGRGAWIAIESIVLPNVTIGDYCVVGAGSVVSKNLPKSMICIGNPCGPIKPRSIPGVSNV